MFFDKLLKGIANSHYHKRCIHSPVGQGFYRVSHRSGGCFIYPIKFIDYYYAGITGLLKNAANIFRIWSVADLILT
jgi:hypothetical protein